MIDSTIIEGRIEDPQLISPENSNKASLMTKRTQEEDTGCRMVDDESGHHVAASLDSRFACNICLEAVTEPVVTRCGHLYCWPCLYQWLAPGMRQEDHDHLNMQGSSSSSGVDHSRRTCPVCKSACGVSTLVPIYVREDKARKRGGSQHCLRQQPSTEGGSSATSSSLESHVGPNFMFPNVQSSEETDGDADIGLNLSSEGTVNNDGLRRRRTSIDTTLSPTPSRPMVPMRPQPPREPTPSSSTYSNHVQQPHTHANNPATFTAPQSPLHQSLFQALLGMQIPTNSTNNGQGIPSLHRPRDHDDDLNQNNGYANNNFGHSTRNGSTQSQNINGISHAYGSAQATGGVSSQDSAMEFLSRLLLMLGSFVLLCLLLF